MLALTTPNVRPDQRLSGEFRPRRLESWLAQLPRAERESSLHQLHKALSNQNRVTLDPAMRLQLMELYLAPFRELYALQYSDLRSIARVPLHPHYRARREALLSLLDTMAAGYKLVVVDIVSSGRGHGQDSELALALQRAMHCLGEVLVTAYELYMRSPSNAWLEVHELYRCAETEALSNVEVAPLPGLDEPVAVIKTYVPILLLGAASPYGLLPGDARRLYDLAPQWRRSVKISTPDELPTDPGYFRFNLNDDAPPFPASKSTRPVDGTTRMMRTLSVARTMHQILTDMNDTTTQKAVQKVLGSAMEPADVELFRRIGRVFGEVGIKRSSNRFPLRQDVELYTGFDPVYFACNDGRAFDPSMSARDRTAAPDPAAEEADEQFIDLSEPMLGDAIGDDAAPHGGGSTSSRYSSLAGKCVNQSAGGLCMVLPRKGDALLKVGDIAACRAAGAASWQVGVVRWLRVTSKEIRFGVQFLAPVAVPVAAARNDAASRRSGDNVVAAIWLPENPALKQANSIVLPRTADPYPPSLEILGSDNAPARVQLLRRMERTGDYEQFLVSLESPGSESHSSLSS